MMGPTSISKAFLKNSKGFWNSFHAMKYYLILFFGSKQCLRPKREMSPLVFSLSKCPHKKRLQPWSRQILSLKRLTLIDTTRSSGRLAKAVSLRFSWSKERAMA
jgi:hypothetical protein